MNELMRRKKDRQLEREMKSRRMGKNQGGMRLTEGEVAH